MKPGKMILNLLSLFALPLTALAWGGPASGAPAATTGTQLSAGVWYVKPGAGGDCLSWITACGLEAALENAAAGEELWAAAGTYYPGNVGELLKTFQLKDGVALYGGFAGIENVREQRDWRANPTILSGDIDRNDLLDEGNAYHVVTLSQVEAATVLDGLTITGGNASGDLNTNGGGLHCSYGNPTLSNLIFSGNRATRFGGGMYAYQSSPKLREVIFSENQAERGGGMYNYLSTPSLALVSFSANQAERGGGVYNYVSKDLLLTDISFSGNSANQDGGGMFNTYSPLKLTNALFSGNSAKTGGGAFNHLSNTNLTNVTFTANRAGTGGAIYDSFNTSTLNHLTIYANTAGTGGGIYSTGSNINMNNTIIWGNTPTTKQLTGEENSFSFNHCDIQGSGGDAGQGNIDEDPLLEKLADNGGYTLTHALLPGSPAIDSGDQGVCPDTDQRGARRPSDGDGDGKAICDMGAYEYKLTRQLYLPAAVKGDPPEDSPGGWLK